ncbi:hypothetical protein A3I27_01655 [Candidatus Giovannonibacteria bacterium RIFCSPLOWO2_02_FULL_43_11b]|nr:MAG: hypothetical protein A3B97_03930 [Candidatus Giovannonibacteria bacterium RIFCSPHIGHO2_02_FULL_43_32]OGF78432.1 MAG: hypothetical protein A3A15_03505 [Candidatus Giovannonibacteria bacterium RIFCSPLOWO2_01_FULL_43_60]OGF89791.1 MAG: hypothetical protein A3I27_01655 [Candidatus Giovannonibacteria bacterium RIFCSPLOWO2_02_FULL_43_11b]OGF91989.1 MAG: hypothetical protein A3H04_04570 [Candidatus Giovannonibacteria bacterium RIFCSPLOWO2_12_FULL_43_11c]
MERGKKIILGIDIGGSNIRGICGNKFLEFNTPKGEKEFIKILERFPRGYTVGIGVAGVVDGTKIKISPNIKYLKNFDFSAIGGPVFGGKRLKVDNDARTFLRAELVRHSVSNKDRVLGITIGTGIGRAFAENGKVKKIKKFEYPEKWEKEYQKIRDSKNDQKLAEYLRGKLNLIIDKYKPGAVILGGGVLGRRGFFEKIKRYLRVRVIKARFGAKAGAIGAAMLWK